MASIRVAVVDDHPVVREGMATVLGMEPGIEVAASADSVSSAISICDRRLVDVVVIDHRLGDGTAGDFLEAAAAAGCLPPTVVVSSYAGAVDIHRCLRAGARGYLLKDAATSEIAQAVRTVHRGGRVIPPSIAEKALEALILDELTARERDVLIALSRGASNRTIAEELGIGEATVKSHVNNVLSKLGAESRTDAVVRALRWGLVRL